MSHLLPLDSMNGRAGKAFMVHDNNNIELFGLKKFQSDAEIESADFSVVGALTTYPKPKGLKYTGTATVYYGTPAFLKILSEYKKTGKFPRVNFQITNEDKGSSVGRQVVAIYGVIFDKVPIAMLDDSADSLQQEVSFKFSDFEILEQFKDAPEQLGE